MILLTFADPFDHSFHHACHRQFVVHCHVIRGETQFGIVQTGLRRIFDVFFSNTAAGIEIAQHLDPPVEFLQKTHQIRFGMHHLHVGTQGFKFVSRQGQSKLTA
ncbi:hypothetical protein D3C80_1945330 [compost metagenome]